MSALAGRLAVVTGASRGIGLAAARALRAAGATVVRMARSLTEGQRDGFVDLRCDLTDASQIVRAATRVLQDWGTPHLVVNNAGTFLLKPFEATEVEELDRQIALNLRAPYLVAQQFLPAMRGAGSGMLINIGSITDHAAFPDNTAYTASKYGLRGLHETLMAEYRGTGVRLTLVSPGATDTDIWDPVNPDQRPGLLPRAAMLRAEDVAEAIVFAATRPPNVSVDWIRITPNVKQ